MRAVLCARAPCYACAPYCSCARVVRTTRAAHARVVRLCCVRVICVRVFCARVVCAWCARGARVVRAWCVWCVWRVLRAASSNLWGAGCTSVSRSNLTFCVSTGQILFDPASSHTLVSKAFNPEPFQPCKGLFLNTCMLFFEHHAFYPRGDRSSVCA